MAYLVNQVLVELRHIFFVPFLPKEKERKIQKQRERENVKGVSTRVTSEWKRRRKREKVKDK